MSTLRPDAKPMPVGKANAPRLRVVSPGPIGSAANNFGRRMDTVILDSLKKTVRESQWLIDRSRV